MIDLRAARANPAPVRTALARKGAAETFDRLLEAVQAVKAELREVEEALAAAEAERDALALRIPNPPRDDVPDGSTEDDVVELRRVGEPPTSADPHDHLELGRFDMERAARMSGARFGYWIGDTARLALALYRLALDRLAA